MEYPNLCTPQIRSLSPNVLSQMPQNFAVQFYFDGLALGDQLVMNNADVEKQGEHGLC
jgi:hypothetical protein